MVADSLNLAPIRMTSGLNILKNKMKINFGATFDPYAINENNQRIGTYHIANGGGLPYDKRQYQYELQDK